MHDIQGGSSKIERKIEGSCGKKNRKESANRKLDLQMKSSSMILSEGGRMNLICVRLRSFPRSLLSGCANA